MPYLLHREAGTLPTLNTSKQMLPSTSLKQLRTAEGILMDVVSAGTYSHNGIQRVAYTCKRPRGRRFYSVIGYENGTFSTAA